MTPSAYLSRSNYMVGKIVRVALIPSATLSLGTIRTRHPPAWAIPSMLRPVPRLFTCTSCGSDGDRCGARNPAGQGQDHRSSPSRYPSDAGLVPTLSWSCGQFGEAVMVPDRRLPNDPT
jgi:hypothetical protein